jgi:hypothetical protein
MKFINLAGERFGRWTVRERAADTASGHVRWLCDCDCGNRKVVRAARLRQGETNSCGCYHAEIAGTNLVKHGMTGTPTWRSWACMVDRCTRKGHRSFKDYGGRGIIVCERWRDFANFLEDMGEKPPGRSLDRVDVNGNYEPGNCRWATGAEQARNKRNSRRITMAGETLCVAEWAERLDIPQNLVHARLRDGMDPVDALIKPAQKRRTA